MSVSALAKWRRAASHVRSPSRQVLLAAEERIRSLLVDGQAAAEHRRREAIGERRIGDARSMRRGGVGFVEHVASFVIGDAKQDVSRCRDAWIAEVCDAAAIPGRMPFTHRQRQLSAADLEQRAFAFANSAHGYEPRRGQARPPGRDVADAPQRRACTGRNNLDRMAVLPEKEAVTVRSLRGESNEGSTDWRRDRGQAEIADIVAVVRTRIAGARDLVNDSLAVGHHYRETALGRIEQAAINERS